MKKGMTIIYPEYEGLYINLTNRCPCSCTFCIRQGKNNEFENVDTLWLEREPTAAEVIEAINFESQKPEFKNYKEFVFCGYGEPTQTLDVLLEVSDYLKRGTTGLLLIKSASPFVLILTGRLKFFLR